MKKRNGFVSNSSTSSFVCDMCGESFVGYDASPSDFDCSTCENNHIICNEHLKDYDEPDMIKEEGCEHDFDREACSYCPDCGSKSWEEWEPDYDVPASACPICCFDTYSQNEMSKYLEKTREVSRDEVFAKIKEINKRRRKLYEGEYISHVCSQFNLTDEILMNEIKGKFKTYKEYLGFIRKK